MTLYVDDLAPNAETARRLGFQVVHYDPARHGEFDQVFEQWAADHKIRLSGAVDAPPGLP
jgi:FMN phosphatase YigB (HAD superfamily)